MPFATEPNAVAVSSPDIRVFFSGLMLIKPSADSRTCEVWVHRSAPEHELTIEVRRKQPNAPDLIMARHVGPLPYAFPAPGGSAGDPPIHGFQILVQTNPKGVKAYTGPITALGEDALSKSINFNSGQFHIGRVGGIDELGGRPSVIFNDGLFYTAAKTPNGTDIKLERDGAAVVQLDPIGSLIGANIKLDNGDRVVLKWHSQGRVKTLPLVKPAAGTTYEIYIINDPLFEEEITGIPKHEEFDEYYKLLREVPPPGSPAGTPLKPFRPEHQFRLKITPPAGPVRGSTEIPCMPGIIDP